MAGQYETFLDIEGDEDLLNAILRCWASLDSPRIRSYLREHGIDASRVAMAVVVQRLVSAQVAGVLFTANPQTGTRHEMLVEASWGLGESVVSGRVQPDVLRLKGKQAGCCRLPFLTSMCICRQAIEQNNPWRNRAAACPACVAGMFTGCGSWVGRQPSISAHRRTSNGR